MPDLIGATGLPVADVATWNAMVDRLQASEPTRVGVPLTPTERAVLTGRTAPLRKILKGRDRDAGRTPQ